VADLKGELPSRKETIGADLPPTRYARSGDLTIAYQTMGDGPIDLVLVPPFMSHVEFLHEIPAYTDCLRRLAKFARVTTFDKSGQGLSDRWFGMPTFEQRVDDITAVMAAVGSKRAVLLSCSEGGPISMMFAATYPARVSHLILFGTFARFLGTDDYPFMRSKEELFRLIDNWSEHWGEGVSMEFFLPSYVNELNVARQYDKLERLVYSPGALKLMVQYNMEIDVRSVLPSIRVPTLVLHRRDDAIDVENARFLAAQIPGAKLIEYSDCPDHLLFSGDWPALCSDIEEFVTGQRSEPIAPEFERVLATVLFTDIVDSTLRASSLGDQGWRRILDEHDRTAGKIVAQNRGKLIKTTGDGVLATFDAPGRAIQCALTLSAAVERLGLQLRAGLHTGEIEIREADIAGVGVHAAARVMAQCAAGEVLVSRVVTDLVAGARLRFSERGIYEFKGLPGSWQLFAPTKQ
jgi:class 3 adenylate cyclase/pimeloyl-ACP methyl ester carboxylesterase